MSKRTKSFWLLWFLTTSAASGVLGFMLFYETNPTIFLPGKTTNGHYQIEMKCSSCHTPFMGVKQDACMQCHEEELKRANDSHPKTKFTDPRNADRVAKLDARQCLTCHEEHVENRTHEMGVSLPTDYCYYCHQDIGEVRPSHQGLTFDSCATAGCHNFHDNTALYEDFLIRHASMPDVIEDATQPVLTSRLNQLSQTKELKKQDADAPINMHFDDNIYREWESTLHAKAGVNCLDCHRTSDDDAQPGWSDKPTHQTCAACHAYEHQTFLKGRHGMRLAQDLPAMQPGMARLPMKKEAASKILDCNACHGAHQYDTKKAAVDSCLQCHNDAHSLNYLSDGSAHYILWKKELDSNETSVQGVSCAACHMPRVEYRENGTEQIRVIHNQNDNLRPNEKMVRSVCLQCHGLQFSIDSLADEKLIETNFNREPEIHIKSIEWAVKRDIELRERKEASLQ
ncbi:NrfA- nitrite reduction protein [bacterium]|nr:NrfA- nitrite reduction protein [bacterium]